MLVREMASCIYHRIAPPSLQILQYINDHSFLTFLRPLVAFESYPRRL